MQFTTSAGQELQPPPWRGGGAFHHASHAGAVGSCPPALKNENFTPPGWPVKRGLQIYFSSNGFCFKLYFLLFLKNFNIKFSHELFLKIENFYYVNKF